MHDDESTQREIYSQIDVLHQQIDMLTAENVQLRQHIRDQQDSLTFLDAIIQDLPTPVFCQRCR